MASSSNTVRIAICGFSETIQEKFKNYLKKKFTTKNLDIYLEKDENYEKQKAYDIVFQGSDRIKLVEFYVKNKKNLEESIIQIPVKYIFPIKFFRGVEYGDDVKAGVYLGDTKTVKKEDGETQFFVHLKDIEFEAILDGKDANNIFKKCNRIEFEPPQKKKFCAIITSHAGIVRDELVDCINKISDEKVDRLGSFACTQPEPIHAERGTDEYYKILSEYKFVICAERYSEENRFGSKLYDAYAAGCVPIVYGDPSIDKWVNIDSIVYVNYNVNLNNMFLFQTKRELKSLFNKMAKEIVDLNNDRTKYESKLRSRNYKSEYMNMVKKNMQLFEKLVGKMIEKF
jgi:hypothetical protein